MLSFAEAQQKVINSKFKQVKNKVPLLESAGRFLAEDIISDDFIPGYDNSAVDGFAVRSIDIIGADKNYPIKLKLMAEKIAAGGVAEATVDSGKAIQITTGAPVPAGCDCIVMKEDALKEGRDILVFKECKKGENIRYRGEDIIKGDLVLKKGEKIYPSDIGVLASIGRSSVIVKNPPVVGIISTGDELIDINSVLEPGKVRDSNSCCLSSLIAETGAFYRAYGIVKDNKLLLKQKIKSALSECNVLLITGGVSVGEYDYTKEVLDDTGAEFVFWRVNQRPGKPMAFLTFKDKLIFALPGNPVSVIVCFEMYVRPLLKKMIGDSRIFREKITAKSSQDLKHTSGRTDFLRVKLEEKGGDIYFKLTGQAGSGVLSSISKADGIAIFPADIPEIKKGSELEVVILKDRQKN